MTKQQTDNDDRLERPLGELLYKTRKDQHKTLEDAAKTTRINAIFLQALEKDDYSKLPGEVFIRGFIKLYATYLGLDPDDTFHHYLAQKVVDLDKPVTAPYPDDIIDTELLDKTSIFKTKKSRKTWPVIILLTILIAFYILGVFFKSEDQSFLLQPNMDIAAPMLDPVPPTVKDETSKPAEQTAPQVALKPLPVKSPPQTKQKFKTETIAADPKAPLPLTTEEPESPPPPSAAIAEQPLEQIKPVITPPRTSKPVAPVTLPLTVQVSTESGPPQTSSINPEFKYVLEAKFEEGSLAQVKIDDKPQRQYSYNAGIVMRWKAHNSIMLNLDNRPGVILSINGQLIPINDPGQPTVTINIPADIPTSTQP